VVSFDNSKLLNAFPDFLYQPIAASVQRICKALRQQAAD
jgi:hypothetical protein